MDPASSSLEAQWLAALYFQEKGPSAGLQFLPEQQRVALGAFKSQALNGPMSEAMLSTPSFEDSSSRSRREAWGALGDTPKADARRRFLQLLDVALPHWRDWYRDHGHHHMQQVTASHRSVDSCDRQVTDCPGDEAGQGDGSSSSKKLKDSCTDAHGTPASSSGVVLPSESLSDSILREFMSRTGATLTRQSRL